MTSEMTSDIFKNVLSSSPSKQGKILPHLQMKMFILLDIGFTLLEKVPACGMTFIHQE